ncbi:hypothetical protein [Bacillus cereus]|uniref:hypothetical protein n=1 Tax=Bacillus cereus TaxID=1396 RepID=UPI0030129CB8
MNKKKILQFALASSMAIGLSLPSSQASAATSETKADQPNYVHPQPPDNGINWKLSRHQEYWDDGYYVVHNTYTGKAAGKNVRKEEWMFYKDSSKKNRVHYQATTYWSK